VQSLASEGRLLTLLLYISNSVVYSLNLLGIFVGYLYRELLFKGHDHLYRIEGIGPEIIYKRGSRYYFVLGNVELLHYNFLHFGIYRHSYSS